jgi:cytochrome c-type biogenesis protein CcmH/NrfG
LATDAGPAREARGAIRNFDTPVDGRGGARARYLAAEKSAARGGPRVVSPRFIEVAPNHPRALHYAGVLAHQQGRSDEAVALIERSLALVPDQADWYSNLGINRV